VIWKIKEILNFLLATCMDTAWNGV
jgi:hypothetical protein